MSRRSVFPNTQARIRQLIVPLRCIMRALIDKIIGETMQNGLFYVVPDS